jgi:holo-[acyl-carrier protein] synthase
MIVGNGVDIVDISRFQRFIDEGNSRILQRIFTDGEIDYCSSRKRSAQHFALRFAAKEAYVKACGTGLRQGLSWRDMEIVNDDVGKPTMRVSGAALKLQHELGVKNIFVSMSHDGAYGVAMVVLER